MKREDITSDNPADQRRAEIRAFDTHAPLAASDPDPRRIHLLALYDASAEADKVLLIQIAVLHAARNARRG
jgi:hypothetical protein